MSSFLNDIAAQLESMAWGDLSKEDKLAQLPTLCDENFFNQYENLCEKLNRIGDDLWWNVSRARERKDLTLEEIKHDWERFTEQVKEMEVFHAEFLRRYFERRQYEHS